MALVLVDQGDHGFYNVSHLFLMKILCLMRVSKIFPTLKISNFRGMRLFFFFFFFKEAQVLLSS